MYYVVSRIRLKYIVRVGFFSPYLLLLFVRDVPLAVGSRFLFVLFTQFRIVIEWIKEEEKE